MIDAADRHGLPLTIFRYDAFEELCCYDNYYDPPLMAGRFEYRLQAACYDRNSKPGKVALIESNLSK